MTNQIQSFYFNNVKISYTMEHRPVREGEYRCPETGKVVTHTWSDRERNGILNSCIYCAQDIPADELSFCKGDLDRARQADIDATHADIDPRNQ